MARRTRLALDRLDDRLVPASLTPVPPAAPAVVAGLSAVADTALDPRFGDAGQVHIPVAAGSNGAVVLQTLTTADGRTLTLAQRGGQAVVERRSADGRPDPAFGAAGRAVVADAGGTRAIALAATPDGGAVVLLGTNDQRGLPPDAPRLAVQPGMLVVRLTAAGVLDGAYGRGDAALPVFNQSFSGVDGYPTGIALAADGRVAVTYETGGDAGRLGLVLLNPDGTRAAGREYTAAALGLSIESFAPPAPTIGLVPTAVAFAPDGGLAVAGTRGVRFTAASSNRDSFLLKLTAAGEPDRRFYGSGVLTNLAGGNPFPVSTAERVAVSADGRITVAGKLGADAAPGASWYVSRFASDGTRDTTLGSGDPPPGVLFAEGPTGAFGDGVLLDWAVLADGRVAVLAAVNRGAGTPGVAAVIDYSLTVVGPAGAANPVTPLRLSNPPRALTADSGGGVLVGAEEVGGFSLVRPLAVGGLTVGPLPGRVIVDPPLPPGTTYTVSTAGPRVTVTKVVGDVSLPLPAITPFEASYTGTLNVVLADVTGDGVPELVVAPEMGGGPVVVVYRPDGTELARFYGIDDVNFRGGARVAAADLDGDGAADVVVTAGQGGGPRVAVFDGRRVAGDRRKLVGDFFAFEEGQRGGANVAAGALGGRPALVFGAGVGGGPRVTVLDGRDLVAGKRTVRFDDFVGDRGRRDGVRVKFAGGEPQAAVGRDPAEAFKSFALFGTPVG